MNAEPSDEDVAVEMSALEAEGCRIAIICDVWTAFSLLCVLADVIDDPALPAHAREQLTVVVQRLRHKISVSPALTAIFTEMIASEADE